MFKQTNQNSFFGEYLYSQAIPKDNFLRQLSDTVDFSFVNELCLGQYDNLGKPGNRPYEPVMLFKILFLSFLYNISLRETEEQINDRLSFKWFLGLAVNDFAPDHSTITVFVERLPADIFQTIFNRIVKQAADKGLVHDRLKIIDSTAIKANVDLSRLSREHGRRKTGNDDDQTYIDSNSPDTDARFGHKTDKKIFYGYKQHIIIDGDSEIIENTVTTAGNVKDEKVVEPLLAEAKLSDNPKRKTKVLADKGYDTNANHELVEKHQCHSFIIIKKNRQVPKLKRKMMSKIYQKTIKERYKVERRFADGKSNHGLGKCRWLGIWKTDIQNYLVATVLNCKRMVVLTASVIAD